MVPTEAGEETRRTPGRQLKPSTAEENKREQEELGRWGGVMTRHGTSLELHPQHWKTPSTASANVPRRPKIGPDAL